MTRTERAWELFLGGIQGTHAIKISDAFELAKAFEEEAAKHEAPKTEGEVWHAVAWSEKGRTYLSEVTSKERAERRIKNINGEHPDDESPHFLVEVRRVK